MFIRVMVRGTLLTATETNRLSTFPRLKKSLKMSPYDYLINYRINESMKLLKNSSLSILDISENVGFYNVSHYIQIFKKKTGQTPLEYRNSQ